MKNYRIVQEELKNGDTRFAIEYQSLDTLKWLHVTYRMKLEGAQDCVKLLQGHETINREVIEVYNADYS